MWEGKQRFNSLKKLGPAEPSTFSRCRHSACLFLKSVCGGVKTEFPKTQKSGVSVRVFGEESLGDRPVFAFVQLRLATSAQDFDEERIVSCCIQPERPLSAVSKINCMPGKRHLSSLCIVVWREGFYNAGVYLLGIC